MYKYYSRGGGLNLKIMYSLDHSSVCVLNKHLCAIYIHLMTHSCGDTATEYGTGWYNTHFYLCPMPANNRICTYSTNYAGIRYQNAAITINYNKFRLLCQ